jgi:hypothetical protein
MAWISLKRSKAQKPATWLKKKKINKARPNPCVLLTHSNLSLSRSVRTRLQNTQSKKSRKRKTNFWNMGSDSPTKPTPVPVPSQEEDPSNPSTALLSFNTDSSSSSSPTDPPSTALWFCWFPQMGTDLGTSLRLQGRISAN